MASSVSGQDEPNPAVLLATRGAKTALSCTLGMTRCVSQKMFFFRLINLLLTKFVPSRWLDIGFTQERNLANLQPSCPHGAWSIKHTCRLGRGWTHEISLRCGIFYDILAFGQLSFLQHQKNVLQHSLKINHKMCAYHFGNQVPTL